LRRFGLVEPSGHLMLGASPPALRQAPAGTVGTIPTLEGPPPLEPERERRRH
jgi:hypothetical protein